MSLATKRIVVKHWGDSIVLNVSESVTFREVMSACFAEHFARTGRDEEHGELLFQKNSMQHYCVSTAYSSDVQVKSRWYISMDNSVFDYWDGKTALNLLIKSKRLLL